MNEELPLFPLHTVLFPGGRLPLRIFEPRYVDMVRHCLRSEGLFGVVPIREGNEAGVAATPWPLGTAARITDWDQGSDGLLHLVVEGVQRFDLITSRIAPDRLMMGEIRWRPPVECQMESREYGELRALLDDLREKLAPVDRPSAAPASNIEIAYRLAEFLPVEPALKLPLLAADNDRTLHEALTSLLARLLRARQKTE